VCQSFFPHNAAPSPILSHGADGGGRPAEDRIPSALSGGSTSSPEVLRQAVLKWMTPEELKPEELKLALTLKDRFCTGDVKV